MICKRCNCDAAEAGYQKVIERRLVPGITVILCIDCLGTFEIAALGSVQYRLLCVAEIKVRAATVGGRVEMADQYARDMIKAKQAMMEWTLAWLNKTTD